MTLAYGSYVVTPVAAAQTNVFGNLTAALPTGAITVPLTAGTCIVLIRQLVLL